jgi:hypothetical protein
MTVVVAPVQDSDSDAQTVGEMTVLSAYSLGDLVPQELPIPLHREQDYNASLIAPPTQIQSLVQDARNTSVEDRDWRNSPHHEQLGLQKAGDFVYTSMDSSQSSTTQLLLDGLDWQLELLLT